MQSKNKNKKERFEGLRAVSSEMLDRISIDLSGFSLDMPDMRRVTVRGCKRIAYYSPCLITVFLGKKYISVCGRSLFCSAFSKKDIGIGGEIKCVFFSDKAPRGE
ncbi:MAG: YabP/YqfC family sporulation protein [Clostridia bacterium]|nr:YabP/YqfC family sporulation protein [Clostridia bacterium]